MKGEKKKMALMIKLGTLYVGDEPLEFRSGPRKYDYRHTPSIEICDTVPGKEIKWIDTGQGLYISKIPPELYQLERPGAEWVHGR